MFSLNILTKRLIIPVLTSALLVFLTLCAGAESINIEKLNFELGVKSLKQNNLSEAIKYFNLVLQKDPDNVEAHYNIAVAYKKSENHEQSLKHFDRVVELLNSPSQSNPGVMNASKTKPPRGEVMGKFDVYTEVKEKEHDYIDLGDMHADNSQYEAAIEYYNLALGINPYNANTYFKASKSYMELNNPLDAEPYINKAIELDPENPRYQYYSQKISSKIARKYGDSYKQRENLVFQNPNNKKTLEDFEQKSYEKELYEGEWIANASKKEAKAIDSAFRQDNKHYQEEQKALIEEYYQDKEKRDAFYELSQQGSDEFSYKQSQELDYLDLADLHFDNQEYETAIDYYKMAQKINPNNDYTYYKLSRSYIKLGNYDKADENIEKALNLSGKNKKYVYFKNQITDRLAQRPETPEDEFYSPPAPQERFYTDQIAEEPDGEFIIRKPSLFDRIKSGISAVKLPDFDFNMPGLSKKPDPLEGKVEKREEKKDEGIFNRPSDYYEIKPKRQPGNEFAGNGEKDPRRRDMQGETSTQPYSANYYNQKGVEFFKKDNLEQAEDYFKKAIQLKPVFAKGYNNLANLEVKRGNLEKARQYALKSVEIDPDFPEGYYNLGLISKKQKDFASEIYYLDRAISTDSKYYEAYFARGLAYYNKGNYEKAKYNFGQVLRYKNDHFLASQNLGIIYANELNYEQAEKYLNLAVKLNRKSPQTYFHLAVVRKNSGKLLSAIEDFQRSIELNPSNYKSYIMLSKCYESDSQLLKALTVLKDAAEKNPENAEIYNYLGLLNLKFNKYEEALVAFRKAVEKNPDRPIYFYNLSQCYLTMDDRKKSNYAFQRAVSIIPKSTQGYTDLAEIFFDRGMASYAIKMLKEGIDKLHNNDYLFLVLSDFYERTGATKAAIDILEKYLDKNGEESTFALLIKRRLNELRGI